MGKRRPGLPSPVPGLHDEPEPGRRLSPTAPVAAAPSVETAVPADDIDQRPELWPVGELVALADANDKP